MARPMKRNRTALEAVCGALEAGATYELAAAAGGISYATLARWRDSDEDAAAAMARSEQVAAQRWLACINRAADNEWRAAAWMLERRFPESYRRAPVVVAENVIEPERRVFVVRIDGDEE